MGKSLSVFMGCRHALHAGRGGKMPRIRTAHQARKRNATAMASGFLEELLSRDVFGLPHHCNLATHEWTGRGHTAQLQACRVYSPGGARRMSHDAGGID